MILKSHININEDEINSTLNKFIYEHNSRTNNLFKSEKNEQLKKVAGLLLKLNEEIRPKEMFIPWSKVIYNEKIGIIKSIVIDLKNKFKSLLSD